MLIKKGSTMYIGGILSTAQNVTVLPTNFYKTSYHKLQEKLWLIVISLRNQKLERFKVGVKFEKSVEDFAKKEFLLNYSRYDVYSQL